MTRTKDPRVRQLARFLMPHGSWCPCWSCTGGEAWDYAARIIRVAEAAGLRVDVR